MMQGWISIHRQIKENWIWKDKPFSKGQAWIDVLLRVNHKAAKVPIGNQIVEVEPGQTIWSIKDMADAWGWSRKKVDNFLKLLENDEMLYNKRTSKYTLLTVANWSFYQTMEHQKNIKRTSEEHQKSTNNNEYNDQQKIYRSFKHLSMTVEEKDRILEIGYTIQQLDSILDSIENYSKNKNYTSLNLTARKWLKREFGEPASKGEPLNDLTDIPEWVYANDESTTT